MKTEAGRTRESISSFFERDHREIDAILDKVRFDAPRESVADFEEFDRRLERHIHWEEEILFPMVGHKAPRLEFGPIGIMKMEHEQIRRHKAAALEALRQEDGRSSRGHVEEMLLVLEDHNLKEEQILYPACDNLLSAEETRNVLDQVCTVEIPAAGPAQEAPQA